MKDLLGLKAEFVNARIYDLCPELLVPSQLLLATREVPINWWVPRKACVRKWFDGAGFSHVSIDGTVTLQPDRPFADAFGNSSACRQVFHLVNARP